MRKMPAKMPATMRQATSHAAIPVRSFDSPLVRVSGLSFFSGFYGVLCLLELFGCSVGSRTAKGAAKRRRWRLPAGNMGKQGAQLAPR